MQLGHVWICPCMFQTVILRWFSTDFYLENESFNFPYIRILFMYWSRGLFLRMVQPKSRFRNLKRDGTTQEFVTGACRVCKFQSCLLAKYLISVNNCSCSHINFGQTGGDLSFIHFEFHIHFKDIGHMESSTKNCYDDETSSFYVAFGSFGFCLRTLKTPPALHSVAKCFAASTQHWCLCKNETTKTAGSYEPLRIYLLQRFFL